MRAQRVGHVTHPALSDIPHHGACVKNLPDSCVVIWLTSVLYTHILQCSDCCVVMGNVCLFGRLPSNNARSQAGRNSLPFDQSVIQYYRYMLPKIPGHHVLRNLRAAPFDSLPSLLVPFVLNEYLKFLTRVKRMFVGCIISLYRVRISIKAQYHGSFVRNFDRDYKSQHYS